MSAMTTQKTSELVSKERLSAVQMNETDNKNKKLETQPCAGVPVSSSSVDIKKTNLSTLLTGYEHNSDMNLPNSKCKETLSSPGTCYTKLKTPSGAKTRSLLPDQNLMMKFKLTGPPRVGRKKTTVLPAHLLQSVTDKIQRQALLSASCDSNVDSSDSENLASLQNTDQVMTTDDTCKEIGDTEPKVDNSILVETSVSPSGNSITVSQSDKSMVTASLVASQSDENIIPASQSQESIPASQSQDNILNASLNASQSDDNTVTTSLNASQSDDNILNVSQSYESIITARQQTDSDVNARQTEESVVTDDVLGEDFCMSLDDSGVINAAEVTDETLSDDTYNISSLLSGKDISSSGIKGA